MKKCIQKHVRTDFKIQQTKTVIIAVLDEKSENWTLDYLYGKDKGLVAPTLVNSPVS